MCGIFGCIGDITEAEARHCTRRLAHRGPDGEGLWIGEGLALGHRRLAILDLSQRAGQPMPYLDGRYRIVYNGEVYNFIEIRDELISKGWSFTTDSDTEVILAAYAQWGADCVLRMNGMWAFAIWDCHNQSLFLSRDRFGKKPLFYSFIGGKFVFASEMKAIVPLMDSVKPSERFQWMVSHGSQYEGTEHCLIEGVKRFPAGHNGVFKEGRLSLARYWNTLDNLVELPTSRDERAARLRELFLDACRLRMRSDVTIGTSLSGGLDSSAVICSMAALGRERPDARAAPDWQHAFVVTFPGSALDESAYAREVVEHLGIGAEFIEMDPMKGLSMLDNAMYLVEDLYAACPVPMMQSYAAERARGVVVSIDGHGGDELFCGYPFAVRSALLDAGACGISGIVDTLNHMNDGGRQRGLSHGIGLYLGQGLAAAAQRLTGRGVYSSRDASHPRFKAMGHANRCLFRLTHETLLPTLLRNYDRYAMASGVEIRMPFMDHRVVSFAFSIGWDDKVRGGYSKRIVRDALAPLMPASIAWRKGKIGFNAPINEWMQGPWREYFLDTLSSVDFRQSSLIEPASVRRKVMDVIEGRAAGLREGMDAWTVFVPYLWEKAFLGRNHRAKGPVAPG